MSESVGTPVAGTEQPAPTLDLSAPVETTPAAPGNSETNPAWNEVLGIIPKEFHPQVTPHFKAWDTNYQQSLAKAKQEAIAPYQPYQRFVDEKINPQDLIAARELFNKVNQDPMFVYERLGQMLKQNGLLQEQPVEEPPEETPPYADPRLDQILQQQQEFFQQQQQAAIQQQQQAAIQEYARQADASIQNEMSTLSKAINNGQPLPEWLAVELLNRASLMTDRENRPVSIIEAYKEFQMLQQQIQQTRQPAPKVVPSGGGFPQAQYDPSKLKTSEDRAAAVAEIHRRLNPS